jgi:hypothetical protein
MITAGWRSAARTWRYHFRDAVIQVLKEPGFLIFSGK